MRAREPAPRVRTRVWVSGRVQGVYFRTYAADEAAFRRVAGWVRNDSDGRVEAAFEGSRESVEAMIRWCHRGSPAAEVTGVEVQWEGASGERAFRVRTRWIRRRRPCTLPSSPRASAEF